MDNKNEGSERKSWESNKSESYDEMPMGMKPIQYYNPCMCCPMMYGNIGMQGNQMMHDGMKMYMGPNTMHQQQMQQPMMNQMGYPSMMQNNQQPMMDQMDESMDSRNDEEFLGRPAGHSGGIGYGGGHYGHGGDDHGYGHYGGHDYDHNDGYHGSYDHYYPYYPYPYYPYPIHYRK